MTSKRTIHKRLHDAGLIPVKDTWLTPERAKDLKRESDENIRAALAQYIEADKAAKKRRELQAI